MTTSEDPRITVIVTAYNRRDYLLRALKSLAQQTIDRRLLEVILSKNFDDTEVDAFTAEQGYQSIRCGNALAGPQIRAALARARGEFIAMLDDDDTWEPTRLCHVLRFFDDHPGLTYYGNTHRPVNEAGKIDFGKKRSSPRYYGWLWDGSLELYSPGQLDYSAIDRIFRLNPGNNSSIVVRRDLLVGHEGQIQRLNSSIDHFLLASGLSHSGYIAIEHIPLTNWTRHAGNWSRVSLSSFESFRQLTGAYARRIREDNLVFLELASQSDNSALRRFLLEKITALDEMAGILGPTRGVAPNFRPGLKAIVSLIAGRCEGYWPEMRDRARVLSAASQTLARAVMYLYMQHESAD